MKTRSILLTTISAGLLAGCGVTPTPPASITSSLNLTGDWVALAAPSPLGSTNVPTPVADFVGALQSSKGTVTGTFRALSTNFPQCVSFTQDLTVSGTIDVNNKVTLTVPIAGGIATITATIAIPQTYTPGTWQIVGGPCAMPSTSIQMAQFAPATGTYTGTLNVVDTTNHLPIAGTATAVTASLQQDTTPNGDGQFPLSGTIVATGACNANLTITDEVVSGGLFMQTPPAHPLAFLLFGGILPAGTPWIGGFSSYSSCGPQLFTGTLIRQ